MKHSLYIIILGSLTFLLAACGKPTAQVLAQYSQLEEQVNIYLTGSFLLK